jgi:hypothetical protein
MIRLGLRFLKETTNSKMQTPTGYAFQRYYLSRKYEGPETSHQLWTTSELQSSPYSVGTQITDHFEVLDKSSKSILIRCGDSPRKKDVRSSDGLFELMAVVRPEKGVAEFQVKSVFYQGLDVAQGEPMPPHIAWLHREYVKILMETAITNVTK